MTFPLRSLPVVQNWDCHATGSCCQEYRVTISDDERRRIEAQGWSAADLDGLAPVRPAGPFWHRTWQLGHRPDGRCVFLGEKGLCRIHERFGYEAKPLPCRLFPFVLVPAGDHWRVGLRFACPSAAANKGRALPEHGRELTAFAAELAQRERLVPQPDGTLLPPPWLDNGAVLAWPDFLRVVDALLAILRDRTAPVERRMRRCLALVGDLRKAKLGKFQGAQLGELLGHLRVAADLDSPADPSAVPAPTWIGRILFRQYVALFTRKDHGPNRGPAARSRLSLLGAALRFARGTGPVPRLHRGLPETTFEQVEVPRGPLPPAAEEVLERYYTIKVSSLQFCGAASFGLPVWEGFELLALTLPAVLWVARTFADVPREQAITTALTVVDDHFGFNRVLATRRQRLALSILARTGQLPRLVAWYSR